MAPTGPSTQVVVVVVVATVQPIVVARVDQAS